LNVSHFGSPFPVLISSISAPRHIARAERQNTCPRCLFPTAPHAPAEKIPVRQHFSPENIPGIFVNGKHFSKLVSVALSCGVVEALGQE
jgi:hypothetical protein